MAKQHKCGKCEFVGLWSEIEAHWMNEHQTEYHAVQDWLEDLDEKLVSLSQAVREGMRGHSEGGGNAPFKLAIPAGGDKVPEIDRTDRTDRIDPTEEDS